MEMKAAKEDWPKGGSRGGKSDGWYSDDDITLDPSIFWRGNRDWDHHMYLVLTLR